MNQNLETVSCCFLMIHIDQGQLLGSSCSKQGAPLRCWPSAQQGEPKEKRTPWKTCEAEKSVTKNNKIGVLSVEKQIGVPVWKTAVFFSGWLQCGGRGFWLSYLLFGILGRCAISSTFCWGWCFPLQALGHQLSAELSHYSLLLKFSKLLLFFCWKR